MLHDILSQAEAKQAETNHTSESDEIINAYTYDETSQLGQFDALFHTNSSDPEPTDNDFAENIGGSTTTHFIAGIMDMQS